MVKIFDLSQVVGFQWDSGNIEKNKVKHNVEISESEEVFFNDPIFAFDKVHSQKEDRFLAFGITDNNRLLIISFTIRGEKRDTIRVISSRDQHKKEKEYYKKQSLERKGKNEPNKK